MRFFPPFFWQLQGLHPTLLPPPDPAEQLPDALPDEERLPPLPAALPAAHGGHREAVRAGRDVQVPGHPGTPGSRIRERAFPGVFPGNGVRRGEGAALRQREPGAAADPEGFSGHSPRPGHRHRRDPVAAGVRRGGLG